MSKINNFVSRVKKALTTPTPSTRPAAPRKAATAPTAPTAPAARELPWIEEGKTVFGLHETRDKARLSQWLLSDGRTLGDPTQLPWCGDYVETAIKKSLPQETYRKPLSDNFYWARNWLHFGVETKPVYGAVGVFSRDKGGHVGFLVGEDATDYYVLGGNQSNAVTITRISKQRFLGARWASSFPNPNRPLPKMEAGNIPRTTNEF